MAVDLVEDVADGEIIEDPRRFITTDDAIEYTSPNRDSPFNRMLGNLKAPRRIWTHTDPDAVLQLLAMSRGSVVGCVDNVSFV